MRTVFSMDPCCIFPQCVLAFISLTMSVISAYQSLHSILNEACPLLCDCHSFVRSRVCFLVVGVEAPSSISELHFFLKIYLFVFFLAMLGLCCCEWAFSSCGEMGLLSSCDTRAAHCSGFSCCGAPALRRMSISCCSSQAQ